MKYHTILRHLKSFLSSSDSLSFSLQSVAQLQTRVAALCPLLVRADSCSLFLSCDQVPGAGSDGRVENTCFFLEGGGVEGLPPLWSGGQTTIQPNIAVQISCGTMQLDPTPQSSARHVPFFCGALHLITTISTIESPEHPSVINPHRRAFWGCFSGTLWVRRLFGPWEPLGRTVLFRPSEQPCEPCEPLGRTVLFRPCEQPCEPCEPLGRAVLFRPSEQPCEPCEQHGMV